MIRCARTAHDAGDIYTTVVPICRTDNAYNTDHTEHAGHTDHTDHTGHTDHTDYFVILLSRA